MPRTPPNHRDHYATFQSLQTRWADNDIYGHMNNVVHYALFDTAIGNFLLEQNLLDLHAGDTIGVVVETGCNYFAEMAFPDVVTAGIKVAHMGSSSVRYDIGLFRNDDKIAAAQGHFVHVYVGRTNRKPRPLLDTWRSALQKFKTGE